MALNKTAVINYRHEPLRFVTGYRQEEHNVLNPHIGAIVTASFMYLYILTDSGNPSVFLFAPSSKYSCKHSQIWSCSMSINLLYLMQVIFRIKSLNDGMLTFIRFNKIQNFAGRHSMHRTQSYPDVLRHRNATFN